MPEPKAGRAILYDDTDFKDRTVVIDIDYDTQWAIPNLKDYDSFNDKTSAIRVFNFWNLIHGIVHHMRYPDIV